MFQRVRAAFQEGGKKHVVVKAAQKLLSPMLQFGGVHFHFRELQWPEPSSKRPKDIEFFFAFPNDIERVLPAQSPDKSRLQIEMRFRKGDYCVAGQTGNGKVVHTHWFSLNSGEVPELGQEFLLNGDEAYLYDSYTIPAMRGQGIERAASEFTCTWLKYRGIRKGFAYVRSDNLRRLAAVKKWDVTLGAIWYVQFRGMRPMILPYNKRRIPLHFQRLERKWVTVGPEIPRPAREPNA
jgi:ribosomal protein S18 acetylase RimI-like enzyme